MHDELREPRCRVRFTDERPVRKKEEEHFCGGAHGAAMRNVAAHHPTGGIGDTHVKMRTIARDCSGQSQDLQVTAKHFRLARASESQPGVAQASDPRHDERRGVTCSL